MNWYGDNDPKVCAWMSKVVSRGYLPPGVVECRSVCDPFDASPYTQCHFFAGICGWPLALWMAGWPGDRPVWTGSCPCQPFSSAGRRKGNSDDRHLWPSFRSRIAEHCPPVIFGEQVASKLGREWFVGVRSDLEALGYVVGCADLCAACVGAPHIRQRLYWGAVRVADSGRCGDECRSGPGCASGAAFAAESQAQQRERGRLDAGGRCTDERVSDSEEERRRQGGSDGRGCLPRVDAKAMRNGSAHDGQDGGRAHTAGAGQPAGVPGPGSPIARWVRNADQQGPQGRLLRHLSIGEGGKLSAVPAGAWSDYDIIHFRDGKTRRIESGTLPLAHGVPARVVRLRGYGNAIVPQVAAGFVRSFMESIR